MKWLLPLPSAVRGDAMNPEINQSESTHHAQLDPWELQLFLTELREWEISGEHHMHKSWQFPSCQQALQWYALAKPLSDRHGRDCLYYLGSVGSGRIETDLLNSIQGHLTRDDLAVAMLLNALERDIKLKG